MDTLGFGHHLMMDHQRSLRRAAARVRLSLEDQAARGLLDDEPVRFSHPTRKGTTRQRSRPGALVDRARRLFEGCLGAAQYGGQVGRPRERERA
jgi:hypothetical protein